MFCDRKERSLTRPPGTHKPTLLLSSAAAVPTKLTAVRRIALGRAVLQTLRSTEPTTHANDTDDDGRASVAMAKQLLFMKLPDAGLGIDNPVREAPQAAAASVPAARVNSVKSEFDPSHPPLRLTGTVDAEAGKMAHRANLQAQAEKIAINSDVWYPFFVKRQQIRVEERQPASSVRGRVCSGAMHAARKVGAGVASIPDPRHAVVHSVPCVPAPPQGTSDVDASAAGRRSVFSVLHEGGYANLAELHQDVLTYLLAMYESEAPQSSSFRSARVRLAPHTHAR